jgi:hypothetical protein
MEFGQGQIRSQQMCEGERQMVGAAALGSALAGGYAPSRPSAKAALRERIANLRREADRLEVLSKALPEELPRQADDALFDLLTK